MRKAKTVSEKDIETIKMLHSYGMPNKQIEAITGWSKPTISRIINGTRDKHIEILRGHYNQEKTQTEAPKEQEANPFDQEHILLRLADSLDYNNALMNGVLNKLQMLLDALGVKQ